MQRFDEWMSSSNPFDEGTSSNSFPKENEMLDTYVACVTPHPEHLLAWLEMWREANQRRYPFLNNTNWP